MSDKDNGKRIHVGTYEEIIKAGTKVVSGQQEPCGRISAPGGAVRG